MRLTAKERILLYLLELGRLTEAVELPPEATQEGVAEGAGVDLRHLTQYVRPLMKDGQVRERLAHVRGLRQRRKVYELEDAGRMAAVRLRERMKAETVRVRDDAGVREATVGSILEASPGKMSLVRIARQASETGIVDVSSLVAPTRPAFIEMTYDLPRVEGFVGRRKELDLVTSSQGHPRVFVVRGVAGIGKSTFGAKACEALRGRYNLFWHRVRSWDSPQFVIASLGNFLAALGRPGLRAVLSRGEIERVPQVLRDDLPGTRSFLVLDDAHEGSKEVVSLFRYLKDAVAEDCRALFLTRRALPFYDRRDVSIHRLVAEIDLGGLEPQDIIALLAPNAGWPPIPEAARGFGGHPLLVKLALSGPEAGAPEQVPHDVKRFLEETVYSELSDAERGMMKLASLYGVPVSRKALFFHPAWSHDVFLSLADRSLLTPVGGEDVEVHDALREFFSSLLTATERRELGAFAATELRRQAESARKEGNLTACVDSLSSALRLPLPDTDRLAVWEALGDVNERLGDLPDALVAYKEAMKIAGDPEVLARLHRKTAAALVVRGEASAEEEIEKAFQVLGERPSPERAWLEIIQCRIAENLEDWATAREHGEVALDAFRAMGVRAGEAEALLALGKVETTVPRTDPAVAARHLAAALERAEAVDDPEFAAGVHAALAHLYAYRLGNAGEAEEHIRIAHNLLGPAADPHKRRGLLMLQGWMNLKLRADYAKAESFFREAAALGRRIYDHQTLTFARYGQAFVAFYAGRVEEACGIFRELIPEIRALGFPPYVVESLWMVGECCLLSDDPDGFHGAVEMLHDPALRPGLEARAMFAHAMDGLNRLLRGDLGGAEGSLQEAVKVAASEFEADAALVHFAYGVVLKALGRGEEAASHLDRAAVLYRTYSLRADLESMAWREQRLLVALQRAGENRGADRRRRPTRSRSGPGGAAPSNNR